MIDGIEKNSSPNSGPWLEALKKKYKMTKVRMENRLYLEDDERIMDLTIELWWETPEKEKQILQENDNAMEKLEKYFVQKDWYVHEKRNESFAVERMKGIHSHKLVIKKRFQIVTEAEKTK